MSSIPSTMVRPLQDKGTPAGPKRSGTQLTPDLLPDRVALQKGWHKKQIFLTQIFLCRLILENKQNWSTIITPNHVRD